MDNCDILLIVPLEEELEILKQCCTVKFDITKDTVYYYRIQLPASNPNTIFCTLLGNTGPIYSSTVTSKAISQRHPRLVILIGVAGSLDKDLLLGDVVVANEISAFLVDAKANQKRGKYRFSFSGKHWSIPATLDNFIKNFASSYPEIYASWQSQVSSYIDTLNLTRETTNIYRSSPRLKRGHIASGDIVGSSASFVAELLGIDRKFAAIEMEAAGVAQACNEFEEAVPFLCIRGLSDFADERKSYLDNIRNGGFRKLAMFSASTLFLSLLQSNFFRLVIPPQGSESSISIKEVEIILKGEYKEFDETRRQALIITLASFLSIDPKMISVLKVTPGSIVINLQLPEEAANLLVELARKRDPRLLKLGVQSLSLIKTGQGLLSQKTYQRRQQMAKIVDVEGIGAKYAEKLVKAGVGSTEALLRMGATPKGRRELSEKTGIGDALILEWVNHVDLYRIKGVGSEYSDLLEAAGVDTIPELAQRNAANLVKKMVEVNRVKKLVRKLPVESQIADWIEQAKKLPRVITY